MAIESLLDTNVVVAATIADHPANRDADIAIRASHNHAMAVHSVGEMYNTLTKPFPYGLPPSNANSIIRSIRSRIPILPIDADLYCESVARFSELGGIGARVYDFLIGRTAIEHGLGVLVTLNIKHMRPLFPSLRVLTPTQYLETL